MNKLSKILIIVSCFLFIQKAEAQHYVGIDSLSASSQISLLTSSPWDGEVYAMFGHSAMRITDTVHGIDEVFNYGIFDFNTPNFLWRFATGQTDYIVMAVDFNSYIYEYKLRNKNVYEQVLAFNNDEKQRIWEYLLWNIQAENQTYRYNEVFNNCTTKLTDVIEANVDGIMVYPKDEQAKTFRELISEHTSPNLWLEFAVNIVFGSGTDKITTLKEKIFLPSYQMNTFDQTKIKRNDGTIENLVSQNRMLVTSHDDKRNETNFYHSPFFAGLVLLFLSLIISLNEYRSWEKQAITKIFDFILFLLVGIIGCIILFLTFTSHPFTYPNWNIIWLNPLAFILSFMLLFNACRKIVYYYHVINSLVLIAFLIGLFFIPQELGRTFIPFIFVVCIRTWASATRKPSFSKKRIRGNKY